MLGSQLRGGEVIELRSDLGGGKTTLVRGLVRGAGSVDRVSSPTFNLSRVYKTGNFDIAHYDFYRLEQTGLLADQLAEVIDGKSVVIVEWAGIVEDILPEDRMSIEFNPIADDPDERQVVIHYQESNSLLIKFVETNWQESRP